MCLGRLLEGQGGVENSVEEGLVGFEAGIDEGDRAAQAGVAGEAIGEAPGDRRGACPAGSGDGDESSGPPTAGGLHRCSELESVDAADGPGPPLEGAGEVVRGKVGGQHGRCSEPGPAFGIAADDEDGARGGDGSADEFPVEPDGAVVDEEGREGATGGEAVE